MGNGGSVANLRVQTFAEQEFFRVKAEDGRDHLILPEILSLRSLGEFKVGFENMSTMYELDHDHDGRVTLAELQRFMDQCAVLEARAGLHNFKRELHAQSTLRMWRERRLDHDQGASWLADWLCRLLAEHSSVQLEADVCAEYTEPLVGRESLRLLHQMLSVNMVHGVTFQGFFDLLQRVGEEAGLLQLEDERLDDVLPLRVVRMFCIDVMRAVCGRLTAVIGYEQGAEADGGAVNTP